MSKPAFRLLREVMTELNTATDAFAPFNSPHEGYAILQEEVDELWDLVKRKTPHEFCTVDDMRGEAIQIAAMAIRFIIDCCETQPAEGEEINGVE